MIYDGQLSGCPISEELVVNQLSGSDSFLISVPTNGQDRSNFYRSRRISYDAIRDDIYRALFEHFHLGSMATQASGDYEFRKHDHFGRYSVVSVEQHYSRNPEIEDEFQDTVIVLGHIVVDGTSYDICIPKINQDDVQKALPKIGTLRFIAAPGISDILETDPEFDGWTFPDGRQVPKHMFPEAYVAFGDEYGQADEGMFRLPILSDFMELNPYKQPEDSLKRIKYNIGLKEHSHEISQVKISGDFELEGTIRNYRVTDPPPGSNDNPYTSYHHGSPNEPNRKIPATIKFSVKDMKFTSEASTENEAVDEENYPEFMRIPVQIFIGEPVA